MGGFFEAVGNFFTGGPEVPEYTPPPAQAAPQSPQIDYAAQYKNQVEQQYKNQVEQQMAKEKAGRTATELANRPKRAGTILTGPRGVQDQQAAVGKSLLGQ